MGRLKDKVVVVIGGHGGIGGAIAHRFADEGATVYATSRHDRDGAGGDDAGGPLRRRLDPSDTSAVSTFFEAVLAEAGRVDVLVFNAGISEHALLEQAQEDHFDRTFALNVRALMFATKAASAVMTDGGAVVLIGSIAASISNPGYGVYSASKAAVRSFTRTWANELAPRGIRVNVVAPGPTDTAMFAAVPEDAREKLTEVIPLRRMARAEEVAAAALFLASDEASFVTGAELPVDGGMAQI